jgi:proton-translocating NADH-quinone oxidoreductase chain L
MILGEIHVTKIGEWFDFGLLNVSWTFSIDPLTHIMIFTVMLVSTLVHTYSTSYMAEDPHLPRFLSYLSLFTFFMLILISSDNFVNLFLGWEGVGLCSYLLISFWFTRLQANKAALKAMIVNRIADLALTIGMLTVFYIFQTTEFNVVFGLAPYISADTKILLFGKEFFSISICSTLLFIGAMGKSAQIGLHTWLPDAMEGPSPVSALIHAATMVTAGVFLLVRCSALFELAPSVLKFVTIIGAATAIMAATSGLLQNDLKKVIAYSTCSQLGFMTFACGVSQYSLSLFHLVNHAFFKALLFLGAGAVIHAVSNEQDTRKFGALSRLLPYTYVMFLIGSLALMGFPFLTGFYSKDPILEVTACGQGVSSLYAYNLGVLTAFFTSFYSLRLLKLTFYGISRSPRAYLLHTHELSKDMAYSLAVLAIGSIFFGYFARDLFIGFGSSYWNGVITDSSAAVTAHREGEFLPLTVKLTPLYFMVIAISALLLVDMHKSPRALLLLSPNPFLALYRFLVSKWGFDNVYNKFVANVTLDSSYTVWALIDKGLLETFGPTGAGHVTHRTGTLLVRTQTGRVYDYALFMLFAIFLGALLSEVYGDSALLIAADTSFSHAATVDLGIIKATTALTPAARFAPSWAGPEISPSKTSCARPQEWPPSLTNSFPKPPLSPAQLRQTVLPRTATLSSQEFNDDYSLRITKILELFTSYSVPFLVSLEQF